MSFSQNLNFIICLFAPAPQLSLQIQVQISQKTWMRNVQFYYTYCYTKYRRIKSWNNSPSPPPPQWKKMPSLKVPQKISTKKKHNLLIKVYRYHLSENDPLMIKKISTIVDVANTEKNLKKTSSQQRLKIHKTNMKWICLYLYFNNCSVVGWLIVYLQWCA